MKFKTLFLLIFLLASCTPATPSPEPDADPTATPTTVSSPDEIITELTPTDTPAPEEEMEICAETDYEIVLIEYTTPNGGPENTQDMGAYIRDIFSASLSDGTMDFVLYIEGIESQIQADSFVLQMFEADENGFLKLENGSPILLNEYTIAWDGSLAQITLSELAIGDKFYARLKPIAGEGCDALTANDIQIILIAIQNGEKYAYIRIG